MDTNLEAAKIAYEAYCVSTGGKSLITHQKLPNFLDLRSDIQQAWSAAAKAVMHFCKKV
jgi:hypothetical protein